MRSRSRGHDAAAIKRSSSARERWYSAFESWWVALTSERLKGLVNLRNTPVSDKSNRPIKLRVEVECLTLAEVGHWLKGLGFCNAGDFA